MPPTDTIAAIATPAGRGGVGMVRVSGPASRMIAQQLLGQEPPPRQAKLARFRDVQGAVLDLGLALLFPAPRSFTGEDVLELHGHGGPVVLDLLLQACLAAGARAARPGEFSERAFLNGKLDLAQAEAIADLIDSGSAQAARAALRSLQGEFSAAVATISEALTNLRVYVEAALDFAEEDIDFLAAPELQTRIGELHRLFDELQARAGQGALLREGLTVVIAGRPNAGKSSLLNALAGYEAAIVTATPGTTRDVLRERISLDGLPLHVLDTAGLRDSTDAIEQEGVRRAWAELTRADHAFYIVDAQSGWQAADDAMLAGLPTTLPVSVVYSKIDLTGQPAASGEQGGRPALWLSARSRAGFDALHRHLKAVAGYQASGADSLGARRRHLDALGRARTHLDTALARLGQQAPELMAEELRQAQQALGEITGKIHNDDLLGRIFSQFCLGK